MINKKDEKIICFVDSAITYTILCDRIYFSHLILANTNVSTILGKNNLTEGSKRAKILSNGTKLLIDNALYST